MSGSFHNWWQTRTLREQRLLLAMSGLALVVLVWLLVIRPLNDSLAAAKERHTAAVLALADIRAEAAAIRSAQQGPPASLGAPVETVLSQAASEAGFSITRIDPIGSGQATLVMETVRPQAFFGWVAQMESRGLIVDRLSATTNSDRTLAVQVTFRARSG